MEVFTFDEALATDKAALSGQAIKYHHWAEADFHAFNYFITWLNYNFEFRVLAVGQTLIFFITSQLEYKPVAELETK